MRVVGRTQIQRVISSPGKPRVVTEIRIYEYDIENLPKNYEVLYIGCANSSFPEKEKFVVLLKKKNVKNLGKILIFTGKRDELKRIEVIPNDVASDPEKEKIMLIILPSHTKEKPNYITFRDTPHIVKDGKVVLMETFFTKWDDESSVFQNSYYVQ